MFPSRFQSALKDRDAVPQGNVTAKLTEFLPNLILN